MASEFQIQFPEINFEKLAAANRKRLGEQCMNCAQTLIGGILNDWTSSFATLPLEILLPRLKALLSTARELSDPLDPLIPVIESVVRLLEYESARDIWQHRERMLEFGCLLADYGSQLLEPPSEEHAILMYEQLVAKRCLRNAAACEEIRERFQALIDQLSPPWGGVYRVRLELAEGEACRTGQIRPRNLKQAAEHNRRVLELADMLDQHPPLEVPGMRRAAKTNLWMIAIEQQDWNAARDAWSVLTSHTHSGVESLPHYAEFAPHVQKWGESGQLPKSEIPLLTTLLEQAAQSHSPEKQKAAEQALATL